MTAETTEPSALDAEKSCLELIARAQRESGAAARARAAAQAARINAKNDLEAAHDASVRGDEGTDKSLSEALARVHDAIAQEEAADRQAEASHRVWRGAQARLADLRETCLPEFAQEAAKLDSAYCEAAEALAEPLAALVSAWQTADSRWRSLESAIRSRVEQADRERGVDRDFGVVRREAAMPAAPITADLVQRILSAAPTPEAMRDDYNPTKPPVPDVPAEFIGPDGPTYFDSNLLPQA